MSPSPDAVAAVALLFVGMLGTVIDEIPGGVALLSGIYLYWIGSGLSTPAGLNLLLFTVAGLLVTLMDYLGGLLRVQTAGVTGILAGAVGGLLFWVYTGVRALPGIVLTVVGSELAVAYREGRSAGSALEAVLGSGVLQLFVAYWLTMLFMMVIPG